MRKTLVCFFAASIAATMVPASASATGSRPCGRILFFSSDRRHGDVATVKGDGTHRRTLRKMSHPGRFFVSPDASSIVFTHEDDTSNDSDLWLMRSDGSRYRNLTQTPDQREAVYDWSPGSRRIAFERYESSGYAIYLLNVFTGKERRVAQGRQPSFSPNGKRIAYSALAPDLANFTFTSDIFTVSIKDGAIARVTEDQSSDDVYPRWSPTGKWLAFSRFPTNQKNEFDGPYSDIWRVRPSGDDENNLTNVQDDYNGTSAAVWSPDGRMIAYNTEWDDGGTVHVMRADGSKDRPVMQSFHHFSRGPSWSPRGNHLAHERSGDESTDIWSFDVETGAKRKLTSTARQYESVPVWASCQD